VDLLRQEPVADARPASLMRDAACTVRVSTALTGSATHCARRRPGVPTAVHAR
jgi:hypothetical protein